MNLSFSTCYYIRKILLQNSKDLQWTIEQNNGFCMNSSENLKQLLDSVYLEDILEQLLQRLYSEEHEVSIKIQQLEALCLAHQKIVEKTLVQSQELLNIQQQIFLLLGFKRIEVKIAEIVNAANQLSKYSSNYLGTKLTINNWQSNRPGTDWLNNFFVDSSAKFTFSGTIAEEVESFEQLQWIHKWVTAFVEQHTKTFRDFPQTIEQKKLGEVKKGLLLNRVGAYSAWLNVDTRPIPKTLVF
ncbi:hypothetical protein [Synechocystis sp. PCC 7509]|uniref:hypothetical protein n=1 Tax=Synechocystis sp. PCC 7509 TaxID=927677 RepID=UPI0002E9AD11|nr:hypothetical protein [Synechocystis sp. PCC 7509]